MSSGVHSASARGVMGNLLRAALLASTALTVTGIRLRRGATWVPSPGSGDTGTKARGASR
jgi:hypothetical protein